MALPSRVFVGITLFGLIAALVVVPYTVLVLMGFEAPPDTPYPVFFPEEVEHSWGDKAFLVLASLFSLLILVFGWRSLLGSARRDAAIRKEMAEGRRRDEGGSRGRPPPPPGYQ